MLWACRHRQAMRYRSRLRERNTITGGRRAARCADACIDVAQTADSCSYSRHPTSSSCSLSIPSVAIEHARLTLDYG